MKNTPLQGKGEADAPSACRGSCVIMAERRHDPPPLSILFSQEMGANTGRMESPSQPKQILDLVCTVKSFLQTRNTSGKSHRAAAPHLRALHTAHTQEIHCPSCIWNAVDLLLSQSFSCRLSSSLAPRACRKVCRPG